MDVPFLVNKPIEKTRKKWENQQIQGSWPNGFSMIKRLKPVVERQVLLMEEAAAKNANGGMAK